MAGFRDFAGPEFLDRRGHTPPTIGVVMKKFASRMVRLVASGVIATALAFTAYTPDAHAMNPDMTRAADVVSTLGGWSAGSINQYWSAVFRQYGLTWTAPSIWYYGAYAGGTYNTSCGMTNTREHVNNGFYCPRDNAVYLDYWYLQDFIDPGGNWYLGDYGAGGFLAHEFGHRVQHLLGGNRWTGNFRQEYAADCYAGMYTRWAYASGRLTGGDYWEFHNWLAAQPYSTTHGYGANRAAWYYTGYASQSLTRCDQAYAATA
jgi:predicted metalloprotease